MSDTSIPFPEGWHEITLTTKKDGEEVFLPVRLTGKKASYKDEPHNAKVSKMFVANDGPGSEGQYYIQFSLAPTDTPPEIEAIKKEKKKEEEKSYGYISLSSEPQSEVYLDGDFIGMTPIEKLKIKQGKHSLELKMEGFKSWGKEIRIISESHVPLKVTLEKEAYIDQNWQVEKEE
jgi:hypothetical protein